MSSASQDNRVSATVSLMHAASEGDVQTMKALLAGGVDVNAANQGGQTALMLAALMGHSEIVTLLLAAGADPDSRDRLGLTALDWSQRRGFPEVTRLLGGVSPATTRPSPKSTSAATEEQSKTEARTDIARESYPQEARSASRAANKAFQTQQSIDAKTEAVVEPRASATKPDVVEVVPSSASPHVTEVAIATTPALEFAPVESEAPILELDPEPQPHPKAEGLDATPKPPEIPAPSERPGEPEVAAESAALVSETASVETERPILDISPEPQSQPAVQQPPDVLPAASMVLPEDPQPSKQNVVSAKIPEPVKEPHQDEEETLTRATGSVLTPNAPGPAVGSAVAETSAAESPRMRAARLSATAATQEPPAFQTSTLGISARPIASDAADVGELKRCPKCNTVYPDAQFSYCPHDYARLITGPELQSVSEPPPASTPITVWLLIAFVLGSSAFAAYKLTAYLWQVEPPKPVAAKPAEQPPSEIKKPPFSISGMLAGREVSIPEPEYPAELQSAGIGGPITVRIRVNRSGRVISAASSNGDRRLRTAAVKAATRATFSPEKLAEVSPRSRVVSGSITYEFAPTTGAATSNSASGPTSQGDNSEATPSNESDSATSTTAVDPNSPVVGDPLTNAALAVPAAEYPSRAKRSGIGGIITVTVRVNRAGKVISWRSSSGDSQLRAAAIKAARKATFSREKLPGTGDVLGTITYNFKPE